MGYFLGLVVLCMPWVTIGRSDWKPFEYMSNHPMKSLDYDSLTDLSPKISVQSALAEGLGWSGMHHLSTSQAFQIVISLTGTDLNRDQASIPLGGQKIKIKAQGDLPCLIEQGQGGFDDCRLGPTRSRIFTTNYMGRVSFSVPIDALSTADGSVPPIFIQSSFMKPDQWYSLI